MWICLYIHVHVCYFFWEGYNLSHRTSCHYAILESSLVFRALYKSSCIQKCHLIIKCCRLLLLPTPLQKNFILIMNHTQYHPYMAELSSPNPSCWTSYFVISSQCSAVITKAACSMKKGNHLSSAERLLLWKSALKLCHNNYDTKSFPLFHLNVDFFIIFSLWNFPFVHFSLILCIFFKWGERRILTWLELILITSL
jgi:hypothetical protein